MLSLITILFHLQIAVAVRQMKTILVYKNLDIFVQCLSETASSLQTLKNLVELLKLS